MPLTIEQQPIYNIVQSGEEVIYTLADDEVIDPSGSYGHKVKFVAQVYLNTEVAGIISSSNKIATLKVVPNAVGRGIFNLSPILDPYVSPDYEGGIINSNNASFSTYNGANWTSTTPHLIHQIDHYSTNRNSVRYWKIKFNIEAASSATGAVDTVTGHLAFSNNMLVFNGVVYDTDILQSTTDGFSYNLDYNNFLLNDGSAKFLTNAPSKLYIGSNDYFTFGFLNQIRLGETGYSPVGNNTTNGSITSVSIQFYYNGSTTGAAIVKELSTATGGIASYEQHSNNRIQYVGVGTGNLIGAGVTIPANWDYYTVDVIGHSSSTCSQTYSFYKQTDDCKGFEKIRLCWLNKFGVWDYYNFTKKSVRQLTSKRKSYTQISGDWSGKTYSLKGYRGGQRSYNSKITESIKVNTDYITEAEAQWLEELFISNEIYILNERSTDSSSEGTIRKYIEPVTLKTSNFTRKTKANNRLIQYTLDLERTKPRNTQRI